MIQPSEPRYASLKQILENFHDYWSRFNNGIAYCEAETVVCDTKNFKRLQQEYETLKEAAEQLQQAMGTYNTEPELIRQFSIVEQEKAEIFE